MRLLSLKISNEKEKEMRKRERERERDLTDKIENLIRGRQDPSLPQLLSLLLNSLSLEKEREKQRTHVR